MEVARAVISMRGIVQGVSFRDSAKREADRLALTGFAENVADGSVRIVVEGDRETLEKLVRWCEDGPRFASVKSCTVEWEEPTGEFSGFNIR